MHHRLAERPERRRLPPEIIPLRPEDASFFYAEKEKVEEALLRGWTPLLPPEAKIIDTIEPVYGIKIHPMISDTIYLGQRVLLKSGKPPTFYKWEELDHPIDLIRIQSLGPVSFSELKRIYGFYVDKGYPLTCKVVLAPDGTRELVCELKREEPRKNIY